MRHFLVSCIFWMLSATLVVAAGTVTVEPFGMTKDGQQVDQFILKSPSGIEAHIITRGATLRALLMPDKDGNKADVVLGFDDVAGYESDSNQYFGCTVGRVCNRIGGASFEIDGLKYNLFANDGSNTLHGGNGKSFDKVLWKGVALELDDGVGAEFLYFSPDGEEGFPGNLHASVRYVLTDAGALVISYKATTDLLTPVNLTNHAYFNLAGAGAPTVLDHELMIEANSYTPTDSGLIPTGEIASVDGTPLDFRTSTPIGKRIDSLTETPSLGYDHNYVLSSPAGSVRRVAVLRHPESGRSLVVSTDQPGLQFYSGNFLKSQVGKEGKAYPYRSAVCLEAQYYPDAVHHDNFPSTWLQAGANYRQTTIYAFEVSR